MSSNYQTTLDYDVYFKQVKRVLCSKSSKFPQIAAFFRSNSDFLEIMQKSVRRSSNVMHSSNLGAQIDFPLLKSFIPILSSVFKSPELLVTSLTNPDSFFEALTYLHFSLFLSVNFGLEIELPLNKFVLFLQNSLISVGMLSFKKVFEKPDKTMKISNILVNNELFWDFFAMVLYQVASQPKPNTSVDQMIISLIEENKRYRQILKVKGMDLEKPEKRKIHKSLKVIIEKRLIDIIAFSLSNEGLIFQENKKNSEKHQDGFGVQIGQSIIRILRKIFEDVQKNSEEYSLRFFNDRVINILNNIVKKPAFFISLIEFETNEKTPLFKIVLDLFYKELIKPERKSSIDQPKTLTGLIENLNAALEMFTTCVLMGLPKELESIFLVFIIKLFDPKTIKTEVFMVLFDQNSPLLIGYLKVVFSPIDKDLIISTLIPIIFFESLEPRTQKTFKDFFYLIKELSLMDNQVCFFRILVTSISLKNEFSQEIVNAEELLMIFNEYILNMGEKEYLQLADEIGYLIIEFFLKFNESFSKKETLKNDIIKSFGRLFKEKNVFLKLLQCENFIEKYLNNAVNEVNSTLFFIFLDDFYSYVLMESELDTMYRNLFFQGLTGFLKKMSLQAEEVEQYQEKILIFFCVFVECLIFQKRKFSTFEEIFKNPDNSISLDVLFHEKKSPEYAIYFLTTKHFEAFVDVAMENQNFQTKEVVINIFKLAYAILSSDLDVQYYFKEHDLDHKLFLLLNTVLYTETFDLCELMFVMNLMLNMATGGEFYFLIEKNLFCKDFLIYSSLASQKKSNIDSDSPGIYTQTLLDRIDKSQINTLNSPNFDEPIIQRTFDDRSPESPYKMPQHRTIDRPKPTPFLLRLLPAKERDSKSPINDSTSILIKPPIQQRTANIDDSESKSNNSPERRSKKSFTLNLMMSNFPKSPLAQTLTTRHQKKPSNLMATHYEREIQIYQILENYKNNFADMAKYIRIKIPYFIDMIVRFLYEIPDLEDKENNNIRDVKCFYISVLKNLLPNNESYNSAFLSRDFVVMRLLLSLRLEKEEEIRQEISQTLSLCMGNYMNNHQLKAIFNLMHYNLSLAEYCQSQLQRNKAKTSSRIVEKCQLSALFTSELTSYTESLFSNENYFNSLQSILKMLLGLIRHQCPPEKSSKILNFSGQNSGIVFTNMRFPINEFTLIFELNFDNLLTTEPQELPFIYHNNQRIAGTLNELNSCKTPTIARGLKEKGVDDRFLQSPQKGHKDGILKRFSQWIDDKGSKKEKEKYLPRIFSLVSQDSNNCLDVYINERKELTIELFDRNKSSICTETFKQKFEERKTYCLALSYSSSNEQFQVFLDNEELSSNRMKIPLQAEKFMYPKYFTLFCSTVKSLDTKHSKTMDYKKLLPLTIENSLSGYCSFFKLIDKAIGIKDIQPQISVMQTSRSLNLNIFEFLLKHNFTSENNWVTLMKSEPCSVENQQVFLEERTKSRLDFMNKIINKLTIGNFCAGANGPKTTNPIDNQPFDVKCKGVSYLEKICFLDFFLMFGNIEVILFMVDMLATESEFLDNEKSHAILLNIFEIIKGTAHKKEVEGFLKICGFKILSYLLNIYIQKRGCSYQLFEHIESFCLSFSTVELKNLAFSSLVFNFELYYTCDANLQKKLVKSISRFFFAEGREVTPCEQKHRVFYLFYILSTFYPLDHALNYMMEDYGSSPNHLNVTILDPIKSNDNLSTNSNNFIPSLASFNYMDISNRNNSIKNLSRRNTEVDGDTGTHFRMNLANFRDLIEIRALIMKLIRRLITFTDDMQIFKDHIQVLFQNIAKRTLGPTLKDYLVMLEKLLLKENKLDEAGSYNTSRSHIETPKGNTPQRKKKRGKTENLSSFQLDSFDENEDKTHNPVNKQKSSTFRSSRVVSVGFAAKFRDRDQLLKSIKLLDTCKLLVTILKNLKDQKDEVLSIKKFLEPEKYSHVEEMDDFLTLILNLLLNFLMEESINEKDENYNMELSSVHLTNPPKNRQTYGNVNNRFSRGRTPMNSTKILDSLDSLLPEKIGPKTLRLFLDTIRYSLVSSIGFESILITILLKRVHRFTETLLGEFWKGVLNLTSQNEDLWLVKLKELPNFMVFLNVFYNNMLIVRPHYNEKTEENVLYLESFLNRFLYYLFYQENALKQIKTFVLASAKNVQKCLEISINLATVMMDKFLMESESLIGQWRNQKETIYFEPKSNQMLLNFIHFLGFVEGLSYLNNPSYCRSPEVLEALLKFLEKFYHLFSDLELIHMTLPEISSQKEEMDFTKLWDKLLNEAIKDEALPRPGGIFHCLISLLFNLISLSIMSQLENQGYRLKAVNILRKIIGRLKTHGKTAFDSSNYLFRKIFSTNTINLEENFGLNPMTNPFNNNIKNTRTSIEITGQINRLSEAEASLSFTQQKVFEFLLFRALELMTSCLDLETPDSNNIFEIANLIKDILESSETVDYSSKMSSQALSRVSKLWRINSSLSSSSSFKENSFKKEEFVQFGKLFNQEYKILLKQKYLTFHENMPVRGFADITALKKTEAFDFDMSVQQSYSKSQEDSAEVKIELIDSLMEIVKKKSGGIGVKEIIEKIVKMKEEIVTVISPILYLNSYRPLKLIEKLACYRLKVYINQYQQKEGKGNFPKAFVYNESEENNSCETFQHCERDSISINERFSTRVQQFSEREEILIMKTSKRWNYLKSQLMTSKGFWHMKAPDKQEILKVDKQQDRYHRRFFLKPLKSADNNGYLCHEKKLAQVENNKKLVLRLSYAQDSPINWKGPLSSRKKSFAGFELNTVVEKEEEQRLNDIKETIIEERVSNPKKPKDLDHERTSLHKRSYDSNDDKEKPSENKKSTDSDHEEEKISPGQKKNSGESNEKASLEKNNVESIAAFRKKSVDSNNEEVKTPQLKQSAVSSHGFEKKQSSGEKQSKESNMDEDRDEESFRLTLKNRDSQVPKEESEQNSKDLILKMDDSNQEQIVTRLTYLNQALQSEEEKINLARNRMKTYDSQQTLQTRGSNDNKGFIESSPLEKSAPMIDIFHPPETDKDNILEGSGEIEGPLKNINKVHSEQLLEKKKTMLDKNTLGNRSASKVSPCNKSRQNNSPTKKHTKGMRTFFKESRNLHFTEIDLKKFTDKDVEKLENIEMKEIPMRDSKRKRNSIRYSTSEHTQQYYAEKINLKGGYYGLIEITRENFIFKSLEVQRPDNGPTFRPDAQEPVEGDPLYKLFSLGIDCKQLLNSHCKKQWNISEIISVQGRSYNLRPCAFELFTMENKAYFFNVYDPKIAEEVILKFQKIKKNKTNFFYNRAEAFKASGIQEKWVKGVISNFEYLSQLNMYAGRTYNDVNQYPVFPWILTDYTSEKIDLSNPNIFRNLSLPIGGLLEKRLIDAREHYETLSQNSFADLHEKPFQYGTHYSGLGPVSYFLIRLEPFTSEHLKLQMGFFDDFDRLFASVGKSWEVCYEQDFKELVPEWFYLPDFLMNKNGFDFGKGNLISTVELPNWAKNPYEFVFRHWEALESEHVSRNLHNWIDLIFGYKQQGKAAVEADNVFRLLTYEGAVDLTKVEDPEQRKNYLEYITKLGQTPHQILNSKHSAKAVFRFDDRILAKSKAAMEVGNNTVERYEGWDAGIVKVAFVSSHLEVALLLNNNSVMYIPIDHHVGITMGIELVLDNQPKKVQLLVDKKKCYPINYRFIMNEISPGSQIYFFKKGMKDKKRVFVMGGFCDGSLRVFDKGKEVKKSEPTSEFVHKKPIISVGVCEECKIIACGSKDCRISLWKYDKDLGLRLYIEGGGLIYGHNDEVITLKINEVLDVLFSVDKDGILLMHEIRRGRFIRKVCLKMERDEFVNNMDVHDNGLILLSTTLCRILLYSMNGDLIQAVDLKNNNKYNYRFTEVRFLSKWNSYFGVADSEGEIIIYDAFNMEALNSWNMKELLQERSALNSFDIHEGEKGISLVYGFEKGSLMAMNLIDPKK